jgi:integrase
VDPTVRLCLAKIGSAFEINNIQRGRVKCHISEIQPKLRVLTSLGIRLAGFHAFRHGVATTLIDRGASITTMGAQLRHSNARITLGLYAHVVPQSQRDAIEELADAISPSQLLTQA